MYAKVVLKAIIREVVCYSVKHVKLRDSGEIQPKNKNK